jgi:hypothetical protein
LNQKALSTGFYLYRINGRSLEGNFSQIGKLSVVR